jgi:hypothetical protein
MVDGEWSLENRLDNRLNMGRLRPPTPFTIHYPPILRFRRMMEAVRWIMN